MRLRLLLLTLVLGLLAMAMAMVAARAQETEAPSLEIFSRFGNVAKVRLYNDESVLFFARPAGGTSLLRRVTFILYDHVGISTRPLADCERARSEDEKRWGEPPSSFALPLTGRRLPVGRYRLRALKSGYLPADLSITVVRFSYVSLSRDHDKSSYRAAFKLRLEDRTEKRKAVMVVIRIEGQSGALVDERKVGLVPLPSRDFTFETPFDVKLSSKVQTPNRERPKANRTGVLKVTPGCKMILILDGIRFPWPVPLPREKVSGRDTEADDWDDVRDGRERGPEDKTHSLPRRGCR